MPTSLGQPWPQNTISLQSQVKNCLTVTAAFPAGVSSSDEESSSSLLSAFTAELVARERLAAAQERATETSCESQHLPHQLHQGSVPTSDRGHWLSRQTKGSFLHPQTRPCLCWTNTLLGPTEGAPWWAALGSQGFNEASTPIPSQ